MTPLRLSQNATRSIEFLDAVAWAVKHEVPIHTALRYFFNLRGLSKVFDWPAKVIGRCLRFPLHLWILPLLLAAAPALLILLTPFILLFPTTRIGWNWRINNVILDLRKGNSLHRSVKRNLGLHYPGYILSAIAAAEELGTLDTALPQLASQLQRNREIYQRRGIPYMIVGMKTVFCILIILFYLTAIFPRMVEIMEDINTLHELRAYSTLLTTGFSFIWPWVLIFLLLVIAFPWIRRRVVMWIPILRGEAKRIFLCDSACSMAHHLRQGETLLQAADYTLAGCRTRWQRKRIQSFRDAIAAGDPWHTAWNNLSLGNTLDHWFTDVAASRQSPLEAFENIAGWAEHDIGKTTGAILRWLDPIATIILLALSIWFFADHFFQPLSLALDKLQHQLY